MAWITSDRKQRLPDNWNKLRPTILRRDGWKCQIHYPGCTLRANQVDHIIPGEDHRPENLQAVCGYCHSKKSSTEGHAAKKRLTELRKRPVGRHPGTKRR